MKIDQFMGSIGRLPGVNRSEKEDAARSKNDVSGTKNGSDRAFFSSDAQILGKAMDELKNAGDVRSDRLDEIRQKIANGEYQINYDELAKRLATKLWIN
jgi:flagellar biosynthesis anti-sigma factor FlgM